MELIQETCEFMVENIQWSPKICQHFGAKHFCCCCCCCFSVGKLWLGVILCDPMNCSIPGFPVLHCLLEFGQTHVHWRQWCHPTISSSVIPFSSCPQSFPASRSFPMSQLLKSGGQSIGASASASVLPGNIQGWFPLGLTSLICCSSRDFQEFSSTTIWKHWFFDVQTS